MNRSRLLMIGGLALAVGLLVSFTVYNKLRAYTGANNERSVQVVVAADDIQVGSKLGDHDLRLAVLPQSSVPPNAYSRKSQVLGRGAVLPIARPARPASATVRSRPAAAASATSSSR